MRRVVWFGVSLAMLAGAFGCPAPPGSGDGEPVGIAPGLVITVLGVTIPADLRPEVRFTIEDEEGNPLPSSALDDGRFILARLDPGDTGDTPSFVSYTTTTENPDGVPGSGDEAIHATYDSARLSGITSNGDGTFTYKFATALPPGFPAAQTHQLGGQFAREFIVDGQRYVDNPIFRFVPSGGAASQRAIVATNTCVDCHVQFDVHGGARREVQLCIMCHSPQSTDAQSGNTVNFPDLIHQIHRGEDLPSVLQGEPFQIIGFANSVNDYSDVIYPQDVRNCMSCHEPVEAVQADFYKTKPTMAGCASCHNRTWFGDPDATPAGFADHTGGMHVNNQLCAQCHVPDRPGVSPIVPAHVLPTESDAAEGLVLAVIDAMTTAAALGKQDSVQLTIDFTATNNAGEGIADIGVLDTVAATVAYPATEYENFIRETINGGGGPQGTLVNNGGGAYSYTFANPIPAMDVTYAVAMEGRREFEFRDMILDEGTKTNGQLLFTIDGSTPMPRRQIVSDEKCAQCHRELRAHGELRTGVDYCVMCHNVNLTDALRRPMDQFPPESVHFKNMIHQIHMGEDLETEFTVFGFGSTPNDFTEVRFPAPQQACAVCHLPGTTAVPLPVEALPTVVATPQSPEPPNVIPETRAACTSCHDGLLPNVHAMVNTSMDGIESCAVCHGADSAFAVNLVHALTP